jgi:hypothetical protein
MALVAVHGPAREGGRAVVNVGVTGTAGLEGGLPGGGRREVLVTRPACHRHVLPAQGIFRPIVIERFAVDLPPAPSRMAFRTGGTELAAVNVLVAAGA